MYYKISCGAKINEIYKKSGTNENEELMFACYDEILSYLKALI